MSECHCAQLYSKYTNKTPNSSGNIIRTVPIVIVAQILSTGGKAGNSAWEISTWHGSFVSFDYRAAATAALHRRSCAAALIRSMLDACDRMLIIIIIIIIISDNVYGVVLMTMVTARVHPVHLMNADLSAGWPPTLRPSQPTWAVSPPVGYMFHPHSPLPLLSLKAYTT